MGGEASSNVARVLESQPNHQRRGSKERRAPLRRLRLVRWGRRPARLSICRLNICTGAGRPPPLAPWAPGAPRGLRLGPLPHSPPLFPRGWARGHLSGRCSASPASTLGSAPSVLALREGRSGSTPPRERPTRRKAPAAPPAPRPAWQPRT